VRHHAAGLARLTERNRPHLAASLAADHRTAELNPREHAICDYAVKLTVEPWKMVESDLGPMRAAGLTDRGILDVNLIVCYFAYVNRLADGLGIALEGDDDVLGW
jgi:uncharacterized peroxidase-related enzyme